MPHVRHGQSEKPPGERLTLYNSMNIVCTKGGCVCILCACHCLQIVCHIPQRGHRPRSRPSTETEKIGEKEHWVEPRQPGEVEVIGLPSLRGGSIA